VSSSPGVYKPVYRSDPPPPSRLSDRGRRVRQAWPVIAVVSLLLAVIGVLALLAVAVLGNDYYEGSWRTPSGVRITITQTAGEYAVRVGDSADSTPASVSKAPAESRLFVQIPASAMSQLTSGRITADTEIDFEPHDGGLRVWGPGDSAQAIGSLTRVQGATDLLGQAAVVLAVLGLVVTVVTGRMAGIGEGDRVVPVLAGLSVIGILLVAVVDYRLLVLVAPLMFASWCMILARWLLALVPDVGTGLRALFTRSGWREFQAELDRQDEQSERGDALEEFADRHGIHQETAADAES
jgi:hypothetical protein